MRCFSAPASAGYLASVALVGLTAAAAVLAANIYLPSLAWAQTSPVPAATADQVMPGLAIGPNPVPNDGAALPGSGAAPDLRPLLLEEDAEAALTHIRTALDEVGDGATFFWSRNHGRLSGTVKPTSSFVDASGRLCRFIVVSMASGGYARHNEGVACRLSSGRWQLEG